MIGFGAVIVGSSAGTIGDRLLGAEPGRRARRINAVRRVLAVYTLQWFVLALIAFAAAALSVAGPWRRAAVDGGRVARRPFRSASPPRSWVSSPRRGGADHVAAPRHVRGSEAPRTWPRRWLHWLRPRAGSRFSDAIGGVVLVRHLLRRPLAAIRAALLGFPVYWAGDVLTLYAALRAFGVASAARAARARLHDGLTS